MTEPTHKWGEVGYKAKVVKRSALDIIFFSSNEHRLRARWRILAQLFIFGLFSWLWIIPLRISPAAFGNDQLLVMLRELGKAISFTISVFVTRKLIDERSIPSLGLKLDRWAVFDFLSGLVIAFIFIGVSFLLALSLGDVEIRGFVWQKDTLQSIALNLFASFLIFALVGWSEELVFRGYHLQTIAEGSNIVWGVLLSSMFFGYLHIYTHGVAWDNVFFIFLTGILYCYAYWITKQLWLPIALHLGSDFFGSMFFFGAFTGTFHIVDIAAKESAINSHYLDIFMLVSGSILLFIYSKITSKHRSMSNPSDIISKPE